MEADHRQSAAAGLIWWAIVPGLEPNLAVAMLGMLPTGIGVGLTWPTLMGVSMSSLPPPSFTTGSGVINMIRQAAIAIGVALFVAIVGSPASMGERLAGFERAWSIMAAITLLGLIPTLFLLRPMRRPPVSASESQRAK